MIALAVGSAAATAGAAAVAASLLLATGATGVASAQVAANSVGIVTLAAGRPTAEIPVGASPSAVAACEGSIWLANGDARTISRIDPTRHVSVDTIQVGHDPAGIACGAGAIWVTNGLDGTVDEISTQTDAVVDTIPVGSDPAGVAVGRRDLWVANLSDGTVTPIDLRTDRALPGITVGRSADGVAVGYGSVWVSSEVDGTVTRIDAHTRTVEARTNTGTGAAAVAVGLHSVWVANSLDDTVTRIDPETNEIHAAIPVGDGPDGIAVARGAVWVSNELSGTLSRIDPVRDTARPVSLTRNRPEGIALSSGALFVPIRASGNSHRGGTLTVLTSSRDLTTVDPGRVYVPPENQVAILTHDGLTGFRKVGGTVGTRLVPDLAVSLPTPTDNDRSYRFRLRPGIRFSNGALVRPHDFRRAIERSIQLSSGFAPYFSRIVGARSCLAAPKMPCDLSRGIVADGNTVTFHLTAPDPDFLWELALPAAFAVPAGTPLHPHGFVPGTGPYEIASFDPKQAIRLVRNPRFREWSPAAQPRGFTNAIVERFRGSPDAHVASVLRGAGDLASDVARPSRAVLQTVRTHEASRLEINPRGSQQTSSRSTLESRRSTMSASVEH